MRAFKGTLILFLFLTKTFGQTKFQKDFSFYWQTVNDNFAYFDKQHTNWDKVKTIYQPIADTIKNRNDFIHLLENANNELYNGHVFLNTNTNSSNRTIPSGADLKVSFVDNKFVVSEVREGFNADLSGLKTGMTITKFNDQPIKEAIIKFLPKSVVKFGKEIYEYAANMLLAGTHNEIRKITARSGNREEVFYPDTIPNKTESNYTSLLEAKIISNNIGYIKFNNSLGNSDLIKLFDMALDSLEHTKGLILDLRETPGGGNTTVARGIMGRFVDKELPYQKHIYTAEEKETGIKRTTLELVSPRQKIYKKPVIVLVGYWTGSMGEGIAIGFDGMKRAKIAGTKMAGLLGEIYSFEMPETKIPFSFPCVQLQHINGQPREDFIPAVKVSDQKQTIKIAIDLLVNKKKNSR
jgi:carboxyl-terminal processing protease